MKWAPYYTVKYSSYYMFKRQGGTCAVYKKLLAANDNMHQRTLRTTSNFNDNENEIENENASAILQALQAQAAHKRNLKMLRTAFRLPGEVLDRAALLDAFLMDLAIAGPAKTGLSRGLLADLEDVHVQLCLAGRDCREGRDASKSDAGNEGERGAANTGNGGGSIDDDMHNSAAKQATSEKER